MPTVADIRRANQSHIDRIWDSWRDLTRFHNSMRIAAVREVDVWQSVRVHTDDGVRISASPIGEIATYEIDLEDHLDTLRSSTTLAGLILVNSWALAEALARIALGQDELAQVEQWAPAVLGQNYQSASRVFAGLGGIVESYVVRNSVAHALPTWSVRMVNRVNAAGGPAHGRGQRFDLSDDALQRYRSSVRSLMRLSGLGASA